MIKHKKINHEALNNEWTHVNYLKCFEHSRYQISYRSMTSRFPPFAFLELVSRVGFAVSPYNKKNITRWLEDMNFMFSWQEQYLTGSLRSLVRYCSCHSNIIVKFISSRHRVISSMYVNWAVDITGELDYSWYNSPKCLLWVWKSLKATGYSKLNDSCPACMSGIHAVP